MVSRERERERGSFEIFYKDILFMKKRVESEKIN